jgi:hypothetical protein
MHNFPFWNGLKHFDHVTTMPFTDGQSFYDILKVSFSTQILEDRPILTPNVVHTSMHCAASASELGTHPLYPSLSMLSHNDWAKMYH